MGRLSLPDEPLPDLPLPVGARARLGHALLRAPFTATMLAVHPRGDLVVAANEDHAAVWDLARGERWPWLSFSAPLRAVGYSADGKRLLLLDADDADLFQSERYVPVAERKLPGVLAAALAADGRTAVAARRSGLTLLDMRDATPRHKVKFRSEISWLRVDSRARRALLRSETELVVVELERGRQLWRRDELAGLEAATLTADGESVIALWRADDELQLEALRVADGSSRWRVSVLNSGIWRPCLEAGGAHVACGAGGTGGVTLLDVATGALVWMSHVGGAAAALAFSRGKLWVACDAGVVALELANGERLPLAPGPVSAVKRISVTSGAAAGPPLSSGPRIDGKSGAAAGRGRRDGLSAGATAIVRADPHALQLLRLDGSKVSQISVHATGDFAVSPDGSEVAVSDGQQRVAVHRVADGERLREAELPDVHWSLAWSPDGATLAAGTYVGAVLLLDPQTLETRGQLECHHGIIERMQWTPDGRVFVTGEAYGVPRIWDQRGRRAGKIAWKKTDVWSWSVVRQQLYTWHGDTLRVWSLPAGKLAHSLELNRSGERRAQGFAVSPDGRRVAWASRYLEQVWVADLSEARPESRALCTLDCGCEAVAFTADGTQLLTGGSDSVVHVWDVPVHPKLSADTPAANTPDTLAADTADAADTSGASKQPRQRTRASRKSPAPAPCEPPSSIGADALLRGKPRARARDHGDSRLELVDAGSLSLPDGNLVLADPRLAAEAEPFAVPAGVHRVQLAVEVFDGRWREVLAVLLRFRKGRPVSWHSAFGMRRGKPLGAAVDSAELALCGPPRAQALLEDSDELSALFATSAAHQRAVRPRGWALRGPRGSNALLVSTGSDGAFGAYLGLDARERPLLLLVPIRT